MNIDDVLSDTKTTTRPMPHPSKLPAFDCPHLRDKAARHGASNRSALAPEFPLKCNHTSTPVVDLLEKVAMQPEAPLLTWNQEEPDKKDAVRTKVWSYADFAAASRACALLLRERGIVEGDRVALMCRNSAWRQAWQFGVWWLGATEVSVNYELTEDLLAAILLDSDPKLIVLDHELRSAVLTAAPNRYPNVKDEVFIDTIVEFPGFLRPEGVDTDVATSLDTTAREVSPGALSSLIYTSGTTGPSKGVMLPAGYPVAHGHTIAHVAGLTSKDTCYFVTPFFHVDFHVVFSAVILSGGSVAIRPKFTASHFWSEVKHFEATWTWTVGFLFSAIRAQGAAASEGSPLRRIIGAPVPEGCYEYFEDELGIDILTLYGQTEADGPLYDTPSQRRRGGAGWPSVGFEVQIHDELGNEVPRDTQGELVYRPRFPHMVMLGYWGRPDATVEAWRGLWMRSGDRAQMDHEGFVYFRGRMADSIRRRGENVSAHELETILRKAPGIDECAVVGVADDFSGEEEIKVFVVPVDESTTVARETETSFDIPSFEEYCRKHVPQYAAPRFLQFTNAESLVRSPGTQVVQKHRLLRAVEDQEQISGEPATVYTLSL